MENFGTGFKLGTHDVIENNEVVKNVPSKTGYVSGSSELSKYVNEDPGYIAIQYGMVHAWQLKPDKSWEPIF